MNKKYAEAKFLFRRQFILGTEPLTHLPEWRHFPIRDRVWITAHPDLSVVRAGSGDRSVTLIGYALDPFRQAATDVEIAEDLLDRLGKGFGPALEKMNDLGGRYVLVLDDGKNLRLFHDAMGLRQVFFMRRADGGVWCASQPAPLAEHFGLSPDPEAVAYTETAVFRESAEYLWPGDTTLYAEIRHLLPNHALDLVTGSVERFWPDRELRALDLETGADTAADLLRRLIEAAALRFPLALAVTAGWDTRLILAACRSIRQDLAFFTLKRSANGFDTTVPPRLLNRLGLPHQMIEYPDRMDPEFAEIYARNVTTSHPFWGTMAEGLLRSYPADRVCVTGNAAEVVRVLPYYADGPVTAELLARVTFFQRDDDTERVPFIVSAWRRWLDGIKQSFAVPTVALFEWEHWGGNFAAMGESEWDIVQEAFTPYDCRRLLVTMLGVPGEHRSYDMPRLYEEIILRLWPEVLCEPINAPHEGWLAPVLSLVRLARLNELLPASWKFRAKSLVGVD